MTARTPPGSPVDVLPHRPPFLFVTRLGRVAQGTAVGMWLVRDDEDFLRGHFPGHPVVPGVLLAEALAQIAGIALASCSDVRVPPGAPGTIAHLELRFHAPVRPPASVILRAERIGGLATLHRFDVSAFRHETPSDEWNGDWPALAGGAAPGGRRPSSGDGQLVSGTLVLSVPSSVAPGGG